MRVTAVTAAPACQFTHSGGIQRVLSSVQLGINRFLASAGADLTPLPLLLPSTPAPSRNCLTGASRRVLAGAH